MMSVETDGSPSSACSARPYIISVPMVLRPAPELLLILPAITNIMLIYSA